MVSQLQRPTIQHASRPCCQQHWTAAPDLLSRPPAAQLASIAGQAPLCRHHHSPSRCIHRLPTCLPSSLPPRSPDALRTGISIQNLVIACLPSGLPLNDGAQADYQCVSCYFCALSRVLPHDWSSTGYCCAVFCGRWCCCTWFRSTVCRMVWCKLLLRCLQLAEHPLSSGVARLRHFRALQSDSDL